MPSSSISGAFGSEPVFDEDATTVAREVGTLTGPGAVTAQSGATVLKRGSPGVAIGVGVILIPLAVFVVWQFGASDSVTGDTKQAAAAAPPSAAATASAARLAAPIAMASDTAAAPTASASVSAAASAESKAKAEPRPRARPRRPATAPAKGQPDWGF